jgi:predicted ribosome quality control (RQC) complex YloA/Tae2 family protein
LRAAELDVISREIASVLVGAPVQKVVQPEPHTVVLGMKSAWLLLSADARVPRVYLLDRKPPGEGAAAPAFCMQLRKELMGARLVSVSAVPGERAVELVFRRAGETRRLWLFVFGRSSQLVLVGDNVPLGAMGPARQVRNSLPPPRDNPEEEIRFRDSRGAARFYDEEEKRLKEGEALAQLEAARRVARKRLERLVAGLTRDLEKARAAGEKRKWADLLLAHLSQVPRGASSVTLPDDFEGGEITIPLAPERSAKDNAQRMYAEHKRLTRAAAKIEERLRETQGRLAQLDTQPLPPRAPPRTKPAAGKTQRPPYREFKSGRGVPILVGRGADRNDELTFRWANGNDLWLHARDVPGAHVVVPLAGRPVDEETLVDAATLAAHHSNARGEPQVDVSYTLRKHVRKPPRSRPGLVTLSEAKTLRVRMEPERLARLLASKVPDEP